MMLVSVWKRIPKQALWVLLALAAGLLLMLPRHTAEAAASREEAFPFSLEAEEKRIEAALGRIEGAGRVTVVLTLEASEERVYARNTDSDRQGETAGGRSEERSEVARVGDEALTVKVAYPRYRGALIVAEGSGSGLRLALTQAVAALTGLTSDRITVVTGK
jgi:stage III sporulation protein AG